MRKIILFALVASHSAWAIANANLASTKISDVDFFSRKDGVKKYAGKRVEENTPTLSHLL